MGIALAVGLVVIGGVLFWLLRAEEIPDTLEAAEDPASLRIPGIGSQPALDAALMKDKTTFFVFVGLQSWSGDEGKMLNRALNRWTLPEDVQGFIVFDAEGMGFLAEKSEEYMERFGGETRFPMYGDFEGAFRSVFKMPRGHHGLVVVGRDGAVRMRKSGGAKGEDDLAAIRSLLRAEEPPPGPPVPEFEVGDISRDVCSQTPCALMFLGEPVARTDIPGIDDGFEGEDEAKWAQLQRPGVRNISSALKLELGDAGKGVVVGDLRDLELPAGWTVATEDADVRRAFGVDPGATAFLILRDGRVAFQRAGVIPMFALGQVSDLLGVEFDFED